MAAARIKHAGLSGQDHLDVAQEAMTNRACAATQGAAGGRALASAAGGLHVRRVRAVRAHAADAVPRRRDGGWGETHLDRASAQVSADDEMLREAEVTQVRQIIERT